MKEKIDDIKKEQEEIKDNVSNVYQFAIEQVKHNYEREKFIVKILVFIIAILLMIIAYDNYIDSNTTVAETTTEQEGIYNFTDSEGNVVSSDLSLEDMKELIEINGKDKKNN